MKIRINGEEYASWDEVPEELRRVLAQVIPDDDHDGVPDALQGHVGPGHHTYRRRFDITAPAKDTGVPATGTRPGVPFQVTEAFARALPPEPGDRGDQPVPAPQPEGSILLNGIEVGPDGKPRKSKHWWAKA